VVFPECGQYEDPGHRGVVVAKPAGGLDAIHARHADVHDHDVWLAPGHELEHRGAVDRFSYYLDVVLSVENDSEAIPNDRLVISE
jgi:hypothetical protein